MPWNLHGKFHIIGYKTGTPILQDRHINVFISYVCIYFYLIKIIMFFFPFFLFIFLLLDFFLVNKDIHILSLEWLKLESPNFTQR